MSAVPVTAHQVRSKVAWVLQKEADALVVGLHAAGPWQGDGELDLGERRFAVVRADTVLEVREALADAETLARPTVVLTALAQDELGQDVVARLARGKLFPVDAWEGVKSLFKARQLDPSLRDRCLAEALLAHRAPRGRVSPGPGRRARRRHRLARHLPPRLRHGGPRARPARAAPLGRGRRRGGPLSRVPGRTPRRRAAAAWPRRWGRRPGRSSTSSRAARPATRSAWPSPARSSSPRGRTSPPSWPPPRDWSGSTATGPSRRTSAGSWPAPGATRSTTWTATSPGRRRATCCGPTRCSARSRPRPSPTSAG